MNAPAIAFVVRLALFGLGKHSPPATPAPSIVQHAFAIVQGVPLGIWVAIIGLLSAIAGPIVAHVLESRRSKG